MAFWPGQPASTPPPETETRSDVEIGPDCRPRAPALLAESYPRTPRSESSRLGPRQSRLQFRYRRDGMTAGDLNTRGNGHVRLCWNKLVAKRMANPTRAFLPSSLSLSPVLPPLIASSLDSDKSHNVSSCRHLKPNLCRAPAVRRCPDAYQEHVGISLPRISHPS